MKIRFINVGYGDAIYVENNGKNLLIDAGSSLETEFFGFPSRIRAAAYLKSIGVSHIDEVIISHIHEDHVCGLVDVLKHIEIGKLYSPYPVNTFDLIDKIECGANVKNSVVLYTKALNDFSDIIRKLKDKGVETVQLKLADTVKIAGLDIEILAPKKDVLDTYVSYLSSLNNKGADNSEILTKLDAASNGSSLLLKIKELNGSVLLCADCVPALWDEVNKETFKDVQIIKLPHHGQADSVKEEYLKLMPLKYAVTTSASDRRYNSANPAVYDEIRKVCGEEVLFLFSDETEYPPYFKTEKPFKAIVFEFDGNVPNSDIKVGFEY